MCQPLPLLLSRTNSFFSSNSQRALELFVIVTINGKVFSGENVMLLRKRKQYEPTHGEYVLQERRLQLIECRYQNHSRSTGLHLELEH
jgi:hypothetical protein